MSRRAHAVVAILFGASLLLSLGAEGGCSGTTTLKREGEACTRTTECRSGLACSGGTCRAATDGGSDASAGDAAP